jgi:hypothetical protein
MTDDRESSPQRAEREIKNHLFQVFRRGELQSRRVFDHTMTEVSTQACR